MRLRFWLTLTFALPLLAPLAVAQQEAENTAEDVINEISAEMEADDELTEDDAEALAELKFLAEHPLDINTAELQDFAPLVFLSEHQAHAIVSYRRKHGAFLHIEELEDVPSLDETTVRRLAYFAVANAPHVTRYAPSTKVNSIWRIDRSYPKAKGYIPKNDSTPSAYLGKPFKTLMRTQVSVGRHWEAGAVMENDAGEPMFSKGTTATDFTSGYVAFSDRSRFVHKAIVGHYNVRLGQGLGAWTGFSMDPSISANSRLRSAMGITPCTSANEYDYLRGLAVQAGGESVIATLYASATDLSVTTRMESDSSVYFSAIRTNGYHRTETDRKYRHNNNVRVLGGYLRKSFRLTAIGIGYNTWHSSIPMGSGNMSYLKNRPNTNRIGSFHADFKTYLPQVAIYGEVVFQGGRAWGGTLSAEANMGECNTLCVGLRRFAPSYYAVMQKPVCATSHAADESGAFLGFTCSPLRLTSIRFSVDWWRVRSPQYQHEAPLNAYKLRIVADRHISRIASISFRVRHTNKRNYMPHEYLSLPVDSIDFEPEKTTSYKALLTTSASKHVTLHTLVERTRSHNSKGVSGNGILFCQDVKVAFDVATFCLSTSYFSTDNYDCRVYTRQPNVLYDMSFGTCSGEGLATCAMLKVVPVEWLRLWLWVRHQKYFDRESIGSGNDLISNSTHKTQVKAQIQFSIWHFPHRQIEKALGIKND